MHHVGNMLFVCLGVSANTLHTSWFCFSLRSAHDLDVRCCILSLLVCHSSSRSEVSSWRVALLTAFILVRISMTLPVCRRSRPATWRGSHEYVFFYHHITPVHVEPGTRSFPPTICVVRARQAASRLTGGWTIITFLVL